LGGLFILLFRLSLTFLLAHEHGQTAEDVGSDIYNRNGQARRARGTSCTSLPIAENIWFRGVGDKSANGEGDRSIFKLLEVMCASADLQWK
jgi:hypothetical protein